MNHWWKAPIVTYESDGGEVIMVRRSTRTASYMNEPSGNVVAQTEMVVEKVSRKRAQ